MKREDGSYRVVSRPPELRGRGDTAATATTRIRAGVAGMVCLRGYYSLVSGISVYFAVPFNPHCHQNLERHGGTNEQQKRVNTEDG